MNKKITLLATALTLAVPLGLSAQQTTEVTRSDQVTIRVTIVDDTGTPLPGASVRIQGSKMEQYPMLRVKYPFTHLEAQRSSSPSSE